MSTGVIIFIVCYALLLCLYFFTETTGKLKYRAPNKVALSLMFFIFACVEFSTKPAFGLGSYHVILMAALFLAFLGDVFLLFDLNRGGDFFLAGNICFFIYEIATLENNNIHFNKYFPIIIIVPILIALWVVLTGKFKDFFKFGKMRWPLIFYYSSITLHGVTGLILAILLPSKLLLGLGSFVFMLSDYELAVDKFIHPGNKWLLRLNSLLYFSGLLLIVLSLAL